MKVMSMDAVPLGPISRHRTKRVTTRQHAVTPEMWNDLAAVTSERLLKLGPQPQGWCIYLNPAFTVESRTFCPEFSREARRCQRAWIRTMNQTLGNRNRRHFAIHADFLTRQLAHSGMLLVDGTLVPPHDWNAKEKTSIPNDVKGATDRAKS